MIQFLVRRTDGDWFDNEWSACNPKSFPYEVIDGWGIHRIRVLGVEAAFTQRSYLPEDRMALRVLADTPSLTLTFLRVGHGPDPSQRNDEMTGMPMSDPVTIDWAGKRSTRRSERSTRYLS